MNGYILFGLGLLIGIVCTIIIFRWFIKTEAERQKELSYSWT